MREQTDYATLRNRCPRCAHRLVMVDEDGHCTVVNGDIPKTNLIPCGCKKHGR